MFLRNKLLLLYEYSFHHEKNMNILFITKNSYWKLHLHAPQESRMFPQNYQKHNQSFNEQRPFYVACLEGDHQGSITNSAVS